jgi:hypothetical protein
MIRVGRLESESLDLDRQIEQFDCLQEVVEVGKRVTQVQPTALVFDDQVAEKNLGVEHEWQHHRRRSMISRDKAI